MTEFNSGTRVTLLGLDWADSYGVGSTLTIRDVDEGGLVEFVGHLGNWWRLNQPGLEVVVNTDTPSEHFAKQGVGNSVNPNHYQFPNGAEVRFISEWLTANAAQALQYIARSSRIDGVNKGEAKEDIQKAIRFLEFELERLDR